MRLEHRRGERFGDAHTLYAFVIRSGGRLALWATNAAIVGWRDARDGMVVTLPAPVHRRPVGTYRDGSFRQQLRAILHASDGPVRVRELRAMTGRPRSTVTSALAELKQDGAARSVGAGQWVA
jgi:hypothetical protein